MPLLLVKLVWYPTPWIFLRQDHLHKKQLYHYATWKALSLCWSCLSRHTLLCAIALSAIQATCLWRKLLGRLTWMTLHRPQHTLLSHRFLEAPWLNGKYSFMHLCQHHLAKKSTTTRLTRSKTRRRLDKWRHCKWERIALVSDKALRRNVMDSF